MSIIKVVKRSGEKEDLNYEKINKVLEWAVEGINGVSASDVAMNAHLQFFDGITTTQIHQVLIQSAGDMITEENHSYQYVASKLLNYLLRKEIFNTYNNFPRLKDFIKLNVDNGVYDADILNHYSDYDYDKIESFIKHERDEELTYAGLQQLVDKYLLKDRKTDMVYETPQFMYMLISMTLFSNKDGKDRLKMIKTFYDLISTHKISLPTPIVAGVRTPTRQYSSCTLIDVGDDLDSIFNSNTAVGKYISKRAGIGLNFRLRGIGSKIRNGEAVHTGIIPFLKMFEGTVKSCSQGGIRGGAATAHYPFWHSEIEDIIVLKNNRGNELNRVRRMDHSIQFCRLFYQRFIKNEKISLFSPSDVPGLYDAFGFNDIFEPLYVKYENDLSIPRREISARELMDLLIQERVETGRIYIMNIDNANDHSSFIDKISMSNLCLSPETEIDVKITYTGNDYIMLLDKLDLTENNESKLYEGKLKIEEIDSLYQKFYKQSFDIDGNIVLLSDGLIEVKSRNLNENNDEYKPVIKSLLTNPSAEVIKITDEETGYSITCTEDHMIWTENRGYVKAIELNENDILKISEDILITN
jgi:ribonucleoside-diphosphate reductase alpha chain